MSSLVNKDKSAGIQKKQKVREFDVGKVYGGEGSSELGVQQAHTVGVDARTQLSSKGRTKKAGLGGQTKGQRVKGRSDDRRRQVAAASAPIEKTIIGSSGNKLGA